MAKITSPFLSIHQRNKEILLTTLAARVVTKISYAAIRGQSSEPGAVQRILNTRRIASIRDFAIEVGDFPNCLILNWNSSTNRLRQADGKLSFEDQSESAQIIDGQHRVAGIREAIQTRPAVGDLALPVAIYQGLTTQQCADIFLSINTEQKTVPRTLVFDLYGVASEAVIDPAALRARDVAMMLHEDQASPYFDNIKLPGANFRRGGIALSTAVAALKPLVEEKGDLERIGVTELELQGKIVMNFFTALSQKYGKDWNAKHNAFQYAAGFTGGVDFLRLKIIPYCNQLSSFEVKTISDAIDMPADQPILQSAVKGVGGRDAPKIIYDRLTGMFVPARSAAKKLRI